MHSFACVVWYAWAYNMLKILLIINSFQHFPKIYPLFLFHSHVITYYFHIILYALLFHVYIDIQRNMDLISILS